MTNDSDPFWNLRKDVPMWQGEGAENKLEFQVFDGPALIGTASLLQESVQGCHGNLQQLAVLGAEGKAKGKLLFALGDLHEEVLKALVMQEQTRQEALRKAARKKAQQEKEEEEARLKEERENE